MSVRRSALALGARPFFSNLARTKLSIGFAHHALFLTVGSAGFRTGWNDQNLRWASVITYSPDFAAFKAASETLAPGQGAPIFTHAVSASISSGLSLPAGGIFTLPV